MFNQFELNQYKDYLKALPANPLVDELDEADLNKHLFSAYEDIYHLARDVMITPRLVVKQLEYKLNQQKQGYDTMLNAGVKSQKIADASIEFEGTALSPEVERYIIADRERRKRARVGRLI